MKKYVILLILCFFATSAFGFSDNDYTDEEKEKLAGIESGAEANEPLVSQSDAEAGTSETEYSWSPLRIAQAIAALASSASSFLGLSDTPSAYTGQGGKAVTVKVDESGLEFTAPASGTGDVVGPASATAGNLPVLDATGKILSDSGKKPGDFLEAEVDGSTTNEINTIAADTGGSTTGLALTLAGAGIVATSRSGDTVTITGTEVDQIIKNLYDVGTMLYADEDNLPVAKTAAQMETILAIDDIVTLSGRPRGAYNFGTVFIGSTIGDNSTVKQALQDLETAVEGKQAAGNYEPAFDFGTGAGDINTDDIPEGGTNKYERDTGTNTGDQVGDGVTITGAGTAISPFVAVGDGTGTDDQTASEVAVTTTSFNGHLANDSTSDTVQKCLDLLDDIASGGMTNPMTAAGDMIVGGTAGAPVSIAKGANNTIWGIDSSGTLGWQSSFSLDDSAAQFFHSADQLGWIDCSEISHGYTRKMYFPNFDFRPAVLGNNLFPASSYLSFGATAGTDGYGIRDNSGTMEYKNFGGAWTGIGSGGGGTSAGAQYDVQIAGAANDFAAVTGEFKYQDHTLSIGTGGMSQAKTSGTPGLFTLYSNNSTDTTGAGLKGPSATLASSYHLIFPSTEPAATAIWAHAAASGHDSAGSWLYPGTAANNLCQFDENAKYPAADGSAITNVSSTPNDTETIYDADGGTVTITKNNAIVVLGAAGTVNPLTPDDSPATNFAASNDNGVITQITINCPTGCYLGKADGSGYLAQNQDYQSGGAATDTIVYVAINTTHYKCWTATGTWTGL